MEGREGGEGVMEGERESREGGVCTMQAFYTCKLVVQCMQ